MQPFGFEKEASKDDGGLHSTANEEYPENTDQYLNVLRQIESVMEDNHILDALEEYYSMDNGTGAF